MIYLDNAATSYPKPASVINAVKNSLVCYGANPGRSGHDFSVKTANIVYEARKALNDFFNGDGAELVSFTQNCTQALNTAVKGFLKKGDHVVISSLEHNSVVRPLETLKVRGIIDYSVFDVTLNKETTLCNFINAFMPETRLCVVTAVSNVFGDILPLAQLSEIAHSKGAKLFVDGAQGAGIIPVDMKKQGIDCLCIPGHKGLSGPMGIGAILHKNIDFEPLVYGGTGSESFNLLQPRDYPERLEGGTINVPGVCGLLQGLRFIEAKGINSILKSETEICDEIIYGLKRIEGVEIYRPKGDIKYAPLVSFNVNALHSETVSALLNKGGVAVRGGYHCAPLAHISRGTKSTGTVRISPSASTCKKDINILLNLVRKIAIKEFI
ncbi:MAG: aminotransferase class V-fold PLP-dependent enzyme [Clostridia bacterium]|nr:aminotransferase class V-fold PLP-dependent enzyme [Clostridia bacterium]